MAGSERTRTMPAGAVHTRRMALMMLTGLAARAFLPFPWSVIALLPLVYGGLEGVRALMAMRAAGSGTGLGSGAASGPGAASRVGSGTGTQIWAALGVVLLAFMTLTVLLPFLTFSSSLEYQQCVEGANTAVARGDCREGLFSRLGVP